VRAEGACRQACCRYTRIEQMHILHVHSCARSTMVFTSVCGSNVRVRHLFIHQGACHAFKSAVLVLMQKMEFTCHVLCNLTLLT
jgi:hypothetical protein